MEALLHSYLLLAASPEELAQDTYLNCEQKNQYYNITAAILSGNSYTVLQELDQHASIPSEINESSIINSLSKLADELVIQDNKLSLLFSIASLQTFIQNNYTGPSTPINSLEILFDIESNDAKIKSLLNETLVSSLTVAGQTSYGLVDHPVLLIFSLLLLERLTNQQTLFNTVLDDTPIPTISKDKDNYLLNIAHWWRARALMTHISLLAEPSGHQPSIAASILESIDLVHSISSSLPTDTPENLKKKLYVIYYLENTKCSLIINTEHLCLPSLIKVKKLTNFKFVLTGARAKRTKFQQTAHSGLIILAESFENMAKKSNITDSNTVEQTPENFDLNSDLLLEKPFFESIGSEPLDEQIVKKQKANISGDEGLLDDKILPLAIRQENIPRELQVLDPNNQPKLSDYDEIQLLLRLYTIRQTTPAKDPLVEEELSAIVSRILYQNGSKNWTIFSRSLWERSIIETAKAKTIERGLLQMQSLVEELGLKISTRLVPQNVDETGSSEVRMKYIHQLPFLARWDLDAMLAEKYMSLGVLRSAVEIYERLEMACEAALCYAAVGEESQAEQILLKRIKNHPRDARAYSILGDIKQDPALWEKAWEIGKYVNAKNSLGRYYYKPPKNSGVTQDFSLALKHLNDSLRQYTLNFETWYFYGCIGLECGKMQLAAEAFSRCVSLDDTNAMAWSNLSAAYVNQGKLKEAFSCLNRATRTDSQKNWRIWENYMIVAFKLREWDEVLLSCKKLIDINKDRAGEGAIDLPIVEKLVEILVSSDYPKDDETKLTYFQKSCIDFICNQLPAVITNNGRIWRVISKVELWRNKPWNALDCYEKAFRAQSHNPDLEINEDVWNDTIDSCEELIAAYESLGEREGRHGKGSFVCKDWKYKSRSTIKSLMSRGKNNWDGTEGWERLVEMRSQI
ncbi:hypothetical protein TBLA_0B08680 [Henningerozyma blattae CBS 6284]|uniref:Uncharacterized protein n=1 Tax=Henningerozyma blattae (strain ATCC 34711 / CBS 6284 / DSM 70876 / NBRC 10599 / NRRL Y-10934 / UCD 77-7) TaxID=1071380 RepID=I2GZY1_HENB6|nr:hypothetical protein TBLA_0B08680 [Tetrapisispora blattae CBS 6284]CCH59683.1 hypothetical protein TBLA_0B08680 [Tetrapisispora blattae CBS 6284]